MLRDGTCVHYRGVAEDTCEAGINYMELIGGELQGMVRRLPCMRANQAVAVCPACRFPTPEEVAQADAEMEAFLQRQEEDMALLDIAHADPVYAVANKPDTSRVYVCELCERSARHLSPDIKLASQHAQEAHGVGLGDIIVAKGTLVAHMDAAEWFQNIDRVSLPDGRVLLLRSERTSRDSFGRAMWGE